MSERRFAGVAAFAAQRPTLVAIGNFDGVHRGHQAVIRRAAERARSRGLQPLVLTFDPHPAVVLRGAPRAVLTAVDRKIELLGRVAPELGVVVEPFTLELSAMSPREFAESLLARGLAAREVLVGQNFRFGRGRAGDLDVLRQLGAELGFEAHSEVLSGDDAGDFSSSRAREALARADLPEVERVLGRPHSVSGTVVRGAGRGRTIGVPTANLDELSEVLPPHGVYAVAVDLQDPSTGVLRAKLGGVVNLGTRPTLAAGFSFEVHLFDFDESLYGERLRVHLLAHLRDERRFDGIDALKAQIGLDITAAREVVARRTPDAAAVGWY